ncbi:MAG: Uncharacterised protein [Rhodospirillaceae bacterium]|nr:MAG: Uncharacterised protein [Rhodospirillaceae bacterium]
MQHDWALLGAVLGDVVGIQAFGQDEVDLPGATLPVPADGVAQDKLQLGPVEGTLAGVHGVGKAGVLDGLAQRALGLVPGLVGTRPYFGPVGELDRDIGEAEVGVNGLQQTAEFLGLLRHLIRGGEDVGVILGKGTHPHDPVQRPAGLVAVAASELRHLQRQVAVGADALIENLHVTGTVHRLECENALVGAGVFVGRVAGGEHVLAELVPVAGLLPQLAVDQLRGLNLLVASVVEPVAHVLFQLGVDPPALGVPEHAAARLFLQVEQAQFLAELAVVALGGLFQLGQVHAQGLGVFEGCTVDPLQLLPAAITAPVGTGHREQLEGFADHASARGVGPAAQVDPVALRVERDGLALGQIFDQLDLELLALGLEQRDGFVPADHLPLKGCVAGDHLVHLRLDHLEVVGGEGLFPVEIVVKAVFDRRADGDLRAGKQLLHRLGQHVGTVVADDLQRLIAALVAHDDR